MIRQMIENDHDELMSLLQSLSLFEPNELKALEERLIQYFKSESKDIWLCDDNNV